MVHGAWCTVGGLFVALSLFLQGEMNDENMGTLACYGQFNAMKGEGEEMGVVLCGSPT